MNASQSSNRKRRRNEFDDADDHMPYDGFIDDDSEPHKFGTSVLPVANLPNSFDGVPQDGMEYLFTVRREEKQLPLVTRVRNPYAIESSISKESRLVNLPGTEVQSILPTEEWRTCFEERFINFRTNIQQPTINISLPRSASPRIPEMRERDKWWAFIRGDPDWEEISNRSKKASGGAKKKVVGYDEELPKNKGKMRAWVVYDEQLSWDQAGEDLPTEGVHYGADSLAASSMDEAGHLPKDADVPEIPQSPSKDKGAVAAENALPTPRGSPNPPPAIHAGPHFEGTAPREPTPELLDLLDQKVTFHLLKYFVQWIQGHFDPSSIAPPTTAKNNNFGSGHGKQSYNLTPTHARWMFALLSRLDGQLSSEEISFLRKLSREVMRVLKKERSLKESPSYTTDVGLNMGEAACWMIVAAVVSVWGQKDLWMDAEEALR